MFKHTLQVNLANDWFTISLSMFKQFHSLHCTYQGSTLSFISVPQKTTDAEDIHFLSVHDSVFQVAFSFHGVENQ